MSRRLLLSYLSLTIFVLVVLMVPLGIADARNERRDLSAKVERDAVAMASLSEDVLQSGTDRGTSALGAVALRYQAATGGRVVIVDSYGDALVDSNPTVRGTTSFASRPEIRSALAGDVSTGVRHSSTLGRDLLYVAVPVASGGVVHGAVRITYPTSAVDARVHRYWLMLAAIAAVVLAAATLVGLRFARSIARPLAEVEKAAARAGAGDLSARASEEAGPPEVRRLAQEFNEMVGKLGELLDSQEAFVADASHQLRTPLTALRLRLENLERDVAPAGQDDLEGALVEVSRLSRLVDALLELARADRQSTATAELDLASVVEERLAAWSALASERGVDLRAVLGNDLRARTTPGRVEQILDNLLSNALEVAPAGTAIAVSSARAGGWVELHVLDEGPGMSAEERARAFDRFWRGDAVGQGSGLGLAIVRRLIVADGGEVELGISPAGGLDVGLRFRAAGAALPVSAYRR